MFWIHPLDCASHFEISKRFSSQLPCCLASVVSATRVHGEVLLTALLQNGYEVLLLLRGTVFFEVPCKDFTALSDGTWVSISDRDFQFLKRWVIVLYGFFVLDGICLLTHTNHF